MTAISGIRLPSAYEFTYAQLLERVAVTPRIRPRDTSLLWPKIGRHYDGELLIVGRAVNVWIDRWDLDEMGPDVAARGGGTAHRRVRGEWDSEWPSHIAWSNLAKVSRWTKGNPSWRLRQAQLAAAAELLALYRGDLEGRERGHDAAADAAQAQAQAQIKMAEAQAPRLARKNATIRRSYSAGVANAAWRWSARGTSQGS